MVIRGEAQEARILSTDLENVRGANGKRGLDL